MDDFVFYRRPSVTSVHPTGGPSLSGYTVTIFGNHFDGMMGEVESERLTDGSAAAAEAMAACKFGLSGTGAVVDIAAQGDTARRPWRRRSTTRRAKRRST